MKNKKYAPLIEYFHEVIDNLENKTFFKDSVYEGKNLKGVDLINKLEIGDSVRIRFPLVHTSSFNAEYLGLRQNVCFEDLQDRVLPCFNVEAAWTFERIWEKKEILVDFNIYEKKGVFYSDISPEHFHAYYFYLDKLADKLAYEKRINEE